MVGLSHFGQSTGGSPIGQGIETVAKLPTCRPLQVGRERRFHVGQLAPGARRKGALESLSTCDVPIALCRAGGRSPNPSFYEPISHRSDARTLLVRAATLFGSVRGGKRAGGIANWVWATVAEETRPRLHPLLSLLRDEEYSAVASSERFKAVERRLTWQASRAATLVIALAAPFHLFVFALLHPANAAYIAIADCALGGAALVAWWSLGRALRHWPELVLFVITMAVGAVTMLLAATGPRMVELSVGYLLFLPPLVALFVPWRSRTEVRWLAVFGIFVIVFFATVAPNGPLAVDDRRDLIFALLVALAAAFTGHVLLFRRRVRSFAQVQALGRLQRRETHLRSELQRVYRSLEVTARTDELTGTGNRLRMGEDLKVARGRLVRTGGRFGLLEVDLDHFKAINDAFGHLAGDEVLRRVAEVLRNSMRSDDSVHRYGGEEFLILLGDVSGGVLGAGERVRVAVEDLGLVHPSNPPFGRVTVSVGAVVIGPADSAATDDEWFSRVDAALYQAKSEGRNRVAVAPPTAATVKARPVRVSPSHVPRCLGYLR